MSDKKTKGRYEVPQEVSIRIQAEAKRRGIRKDELVEEILIKKFGNDRPSYRLRGHLQA